MHSVVPPRKPLRSRNGLVSVSVLLEPASSDPSAVPSTPMNPLGVASTLLRVSPKPSTEPLPVRRPPPTPRRTALFPPAVGSRSDSALLLPCSFLSSEHLDCRRPFALRDTILFRDMVEPSGLMPFIPFVAACSIYLNDLVGSWRFAGLRVPVCARKDDAGQMRRCQIKALFTPSCPPAWTYLYPMVSRPFHCFISA